MNTLRKLVDGWEQRAERAKQSAQIEKEDEDGERETVMRLKTRAWMYRKCGRELSAELPKWERAIEAAKELLHARSNGCTEVAGYDDDGHPLTREGVASKNLRAALKEIEQ